MTILAKLLTESEAYDPEYGGGLCNHLPLALTALDQMGATPASSTTIAARMCRGWRSCRTREAAPAGAWPFRKADHAGFVDLQADFRQRIAREGWEPVLRATLPELAPGSRRRRSMG